MRTTRTVAYASGHQMVVSGTMDDIVRKAEKYDKYCEGWELLPAPRVSDEAKEESLREAVKYGCSVTKEMTR